MKASSLEKICQKFSMGNKPNPDLFYGILIISSMFGSILGIFAILLFFSQRFDSLMRFFYLFALITSITFLSPDANQLARGPRNIWLHPHFHNSICYLIFLLTGVTSIFSMISTIYFLVCVFFQCLYYNNPPTTQAADKKDIRNINYALQHEDVRKLFVSLEVFSIFFLFKSVIWRHDLLSLITFVVYLISGTMYPYVASYDHNRLWVVMKKTSDDLILQLDGYWKLSLVIIVDVVESIGSLAKSMFPTNPIKIHFQ